MTRINLIPASKLTDQHLVAEKKEINQLAGQLLKSLKSPNFAYNKLPKQFTLGTGHVRFFYRYGAFMRKRYREVYDQCVHRKFDVEDNFNDVWATLPSHYNLDYTPTKDDLDISVERIISKIKAKPNYYRLRRVKINAEDYISSLC